MSYSKDKLPEIIERNKSMVEKNLELIDAPILADITEEKFFNVLKGRRQSAEDAVWAMHEIDDMEKSLNISSDKSYYKNKLPDLIKKLKGMVDRNLPIIDTDIDESISEDKNHLVLKARKTASIDCKWAAYKVDELEELLTGKDKEEKAKKKSWSIRAAEEKENKKE